MVGGGCRMEEGSRGTALWITYGLRDLFLCPSRNHQEGAWLLESEYAAPERTRKGPQRSPKPSYLKLRRLVRICRGDTDPCSTSQMTPQSATFCLPFVCQCLWRLRGLLVPGSSDQALLPGRFSGLGFRELAPQ